MKMNPKSEIKSIFTNNIIQFKIYNYNILNSYTFQSFLDIDFTFQSSVPQVLPFWEGILPAIPHIFEELNLHILMSGFGVTVDQMFFYRSVLRPVFLESSPKRHSCFPNILFRAFTSDEINAGVVTSGSLVDSICIFVGLACSFLLFSFGFVFADVACGFADVREPCRVVIVVVVVVVEE